MNPEITFQYVPGAQIGYGRVGVYMARELAKRGIAVYDDGGDPHSTNPTRTRAPEPTNLMCWVTVFAHAKGWWEGQHRAIFTMWETDRLPEAFRETIHEFQTIIVPSTQNLELFSRYHDNVHLNVLGVDPELWHYTPPPEQNLTFDFLISGRGGRKGTDLTYEAFQRVFGQWWTYDDDDRPAFKGPMDRPFPRLVMKSLQGHGDFYAPGIKHVTGRLTERVEVELYRNCHVYVQPSRGEGFGLQPLQALATGRPTILTGAHGHESFMHMGIPLGTTMTKAGYFLSGEAGDWWEPDFDELCEAMWDVYQNYEPHAARAKEAAETIAQDWTWERTTDRFVDLLGTEMVKPYEGNGTWIKPRPQLFKIITNQDHTSDAAGITYHFEKGKEYWEIADIKRILFDAGKLDPACIDDDDPGLAENQVAFIDGYRAQHEFCPTCQQQLNTRPTFADKFLAEYET